MWSSGDIQIDFYVPFGLEAMAQQAVSSFLAIVLLSKESPVNRNASGVTKDCCCHTPKKHTEEDMKGSQAHYIQWWLLQYHVAKNEDEVVKAYEYDHSGEVWIQQFAATDLSCRHLNNFFIVKKQIIFTCHFQALPLIVQHINIQQSKHRFGMLENKDIFQNVSSPSPVQQFDNKLVLNLIQISMKNNNQNLARRMQKMSLSQESSNSRAQGTKLNLYKCVTQYREYTEIPQLKGKQNDIKQFVTQGKYKVLFVFGPSGCGKHMLIANYLHNKRVPYQFRSQQLKQSKSAYDDAQYDNFNQYQNRKIKNLRDVIRESLGKAQSSILNVVQVYQDFPIPYSEISQSELSAVMQFKQQFFKCIQKINCKIIFLLNSEIYNNYYILPKDCPSAIKQISLKPYTSTAVKSILKNFYHKYPIFEQSLQNRGNYKDIIDEIIQISGGDMRKVLLNIYKQANFQQSYKKIQMRKEEKSIYKEKLKNEQKFPLFHMLGKYLYAKRFDPNHKDKNRHFSKEELIRDDPPFYFDPVNMYNKSNVSLSTFTDLLFENYLTKIATVEDAKNISDLFCHLDCIFPFYITGKRIDFQSTQSQNLYIFLLTWGIILKNKSSSKVKTKFSSFKKSQQRYIAFQINSKMELMKKYLSHFNISSAVRWGYMVRNTTPKKSYLIKNVIKKRNRIINLIREEENLEVANEQQQQEDPTLNQELQVGCDQFIKNYNSVKKKKQQQEQIKQIFQREFSQDESDIDSD